MAPSPKPTERKHLFERIYLLAFVLGCFFFLLLWNSFGRSHDPGFDNELSKRIKVNHCFPDPLSAHTQLNETKS